MELPAGQGSRPFEAAVPVLPDRTVRVLFGRGAVDHVAAETRTVGGRALLVAGPRQDRVVRGLIERLGTAYVARVREVAEHVPAPLVAATLQRVADAEADVLVAVGGGSATGLAKAVVRESGLPLVAVPTTYAGSEMTPLWGVTDETGKRTGRDPRVLPRTVVYDPELTCSLPASLAATSGMNALAHAVEALYAPDATPLTLRAAQEAASSLAASLPHLGARPQNLDARSRALYGAWLAGWALGGSTMGLHHKLAHVLGGRCALPHAATHSVLLPHVAAFNLPFAPEAFAQAAAALGVATAAEVPGALHELAERCGAPTSLGALGLDPAMVDTVSAEVVAAPVPNPRPVTTADVAHLLRAAHRGGCPEPMDAVPSRGEP